jgi:hypothetical protein
LPGDAGLEDEDDAGEGRTIRDAGPAALRLGRFLRQEQCDGFPQVVGDEGIVLHEPDDATPDGY